MRKGETTMKRDIVRGLAVLGVFAVGELLTPVTHEANAQMFGGPPGFYGGQYRFRARGRGFYPAPAVGMFPPAPYVSTTYFQAAPVVVSEIRVIQPAPLVERRVVQPPPIVESRVIQPPPVVERRVIQPPPVVESRVVPSPPIVERREYSSAYPY